MNSRTRGFTLIELVVVVAIIAILALIAYPSYRNYVFRAHRADGKEFAMRIAAAEERYFTNFNRYNSDLPTLGFASTLSEKGYYSATVTLQNAEQTYLITLAPASGQVGDKCGNLTINNTGFKDWTGAKPPTNGNCW
jgi:type IV pilus assembly protein PilE